MNSKLHSMNIAAGLALLSSAGLANAAVGDSVSFGFNLPATAESSQTPPYPEVAKLTLTQLDGAVEFMLDPNEDSPGVNFLNSTVGYLDIVYSGSALNGAFWSNPDGKIDTLTYETNGNTFDSSYSAADEFIKVNFFQTSANNFNFSETSTWTIIGTVLEDFTGSEATSNAMPSPIYALISVDSYSISGQSTSNWVATEYQTTVTTVPVPAAAWLFGFGLTALVSISRRKA